MTQITPISYDHGVSDKKLIGETIGAFFDRAVENWRDREALVVRQQDVRWSWGELGRRVDDLAAGLLSLGLQPGDRVGMWSPNRSEWTLTQFATAKAGLVLVNVNPAYRRSELEYAMNKVECKALVLAPALKTSNYLEITADLVKAGKLPHLKHIVRLGAEKTPGMLNFDDVARRRRQCRADAAGRDRAEAAVRRRHQHPVHLGHHRAPQGRDAQPSQHPEQRLLRRPAGSGSRPTTGCAFPCRSITASAW